MKIARLLLVSALLPALPPIALAGKPPKTFDGYVTSVANANEFDVGPRHVLCDAKTEHPLPVIDPAHAAGGPIDISVAVGSHVHVEGQFEKDGSFVARVVQVILDPELTDKSELEGTGLLTSVSTAANPTLWVDGYRLALTPATKITAADGKPLPMERVHPGMSASFTANREQGFSLRALTVTVTPRITSPEEIEFRGKSKPTIDLPDYAHHWPGHIQWPKGSAIEILPDQQVQDYVTRVGESLIPQFEKDLADSDPTKVHFQFLVIHSVPKKKRLTSVMFGSNGEIAVSDTELVLLQDEAGLAALLSQMIASIVEDQFYQHTQSLKIHRNLQLVGWVTIGGYLGSPLLIANTITYDNLILKMNEEAGRFGIQNLVTAGYDPREAASAWAIIATGKKVANPQPDGVPVQPLVQNLESVLRSQYATLDYSTLKTNADEYQQMLIGLRADDPDLKEAKNRL